MILSDYLSKAIRFNEGDKLPVSGKKIVYRTCNIISNGLVISDISHIHLGIMAEAVNFRNTCWHRVYDYAYVS